MKHAVLGMGGVGGLLAALLGQSGYEVIAIVRPESVRLHPKTVVADRQNAFELAGFPGSGATRAQANGRRSRNKAWVELEQKHVILLRIAYGAIIAETDSDYQQGIAAIHASTPLSAATGFEAQENAHARN